MTHSDSSDVDAKSDKQGILPAAKAARDGGPDMLNFEIFVQPKFSKLELSAIAAVLDTANDVQTKVRFNWTICSDTPGLVANGNFLVRAQPIIEGDFLKDCMIIVGGDECNSNAWMRRVRAMQRHKRPVVMLSDAATEFVKTTRQAALPATTHWRDIPILNEIDDFSGLSTKLAEYGNNILTCAGRGHTLDVMFNLVADFMTPHEKADMASLLMLDSIRGFHREQPKGHAQGNTFLEGPLKRAIQLMEDTIEEPLPIGGLADQVGISTRQLERLFKIRLNSSPAKTYKKIRLKRARSLVVETRISLLEIAIACGFSSTTSMSKAFRQAHGVTPNHLRKKPRE
ncbi:helix-turn-helix domain-containing protein [Shimia thalassica]|uniref:GlxA family transcriptional regulator n=1 Tax=Shimia thalassica TaxID=1715693 RepID=UPI0027336A64|nr:helix-turn-helix domain-containing protein [Shimia thalassica]MDP2494341.1 helix-turn-helix domain-containing protein [Shimia thalassica]